MTGSAPPPARVPAAPPVPPPATGPALALDRVAALLGAELGYLAQLAAEVQHALAQCEFAAPPRASVLRGLQRIDRISQGLDDLGHLVTALPVEAIRAVAVPADPLIAGIRLHDLCNRLAPTAVTAAHPLADAPPPPARASGRAGCPDTDAGKGEVTWF
jgi:hypothetical protein